MNRDNIRKSLLIMAFIIFLISTGCKDKQDFECDIGNPNAETLCFSSVDSTAEVDDNTHIVDVFDVGDNICVILQNVIPDDSFVQIKYTALILSGVDCKELSRVCLDTRDHNISSFCYAENNRIAGADSNGGYAVFDLEDGSLVYNGMDSDDSVLIPSVSSAANGFVYLSDNQITKLSSSGQVEGYISLNEDIIEIPNRNAYFCKGSSEYITVNRDMQITYYCVDFDKESIIEVAREGDFQLDWPSLYNNGGFAYDQYSGTIYEINPGSKTKAACAYQKYMLVKPLIGIDSDPKLFLLNSCRYVQASVMGSVIEVELIIPDNTIRLNEREIVTVKGDNATRDMALAMAAYLYNSSQNEYLVAIEEYGEGYGYETTEEASRRNLRLLQDFQQGNSPDIFYGNTLDYNYMGNNGLVMDMAPLIGSSEVIGPDSIEGDIYELFFDDDQCYQLFNGYQLFGLFGDKTIIRGKQKDISIYENNEFSNTMRNRYSYSDMMCMLLSYPIYEVSSNPEMLDESVLKRMLTIAVDIGISPEDQASGNLVVNDNENTFLSYFGSYRQFLMMSQARGDVFTYLGYPTFGTSAYMASPSCLVAISAGTDHADECFDFIEYLYSDEVQQMCLVNDYTPVKKETFDMYINYVQNPELVPLDDPLMKYLVSSYGDVRGNINQSEIIDSYINAVNSVDGLLTFDWGLHLIVSEEVNSYFYQNKSIDSIASSLRQRIILYLQENSLYGY